MTRQWVFLAKKSSTLSTEQGKAIKNQTLMHKQAYVNRFNTNFKFQLIFKWLYKKIN